jgi:hypothetical protein
LIKEAEEDKTHTLYPNRIECPEVNLNIYSQLIFHKGTKIIVWRQELNFQQIVIDNWMSTNKRVKLALYLTPYTKN